MKTIETQENYICADDLRGVEFHMTLEEIREMERKIDNIVGNTFLEGYKDRLLARDMMKKGFLAAFTKFIVEQR